MKQQAVMFDLDGTLVDSLGDIAAAGNHALKCLSRPTYPTSAYPRFVGHGARWLMQQAVGEDHPHQVDEGLAMFRAYYEEHGLDHSHLYPGISDLLDALVEGGCKLTILSNKPDAAVQQVHRALLSRWPFAIVLGQRDGFALKPDPAEALHIAATLGIHPGKWLFIGDSQVDMRTAKSAGIRAMGVTWGFGDEDELRSGGADVVITHPLQVHKNPV